MAQITAAKALIDSVIGHDVDTFFGLPGGQIYDFFDALDMAGDKIEVVTSRHEQGCAYMAYGYTQSTGKVGVYIVVPGPGVLNSTAALCTAYGANAKVLCISGQIPSDGIGKGVGYLHELPDQLAMMRGVTKWAERIDRPEDTPGLVREAFRQLHTGRPRPVELEMAMDVTEQTADISLDFPPLEIEKPELDPDDLSRAAKLLANAKKPVIMIGGGCVDAGAPLLALAECLQAPVVSFRHGRGVVSDEHYLGQSYPAGNRLWADADVALAVGTRLKYPLMYWGTKGLDIVRIDIDPTEVSRLKAPTVGIVGDATDALEQLLPLVEKQSSNRASRKEELLNLKATMHREFSEIQPQMSFLNAIRNVLPRDGIFVDEVTQVGFTSWYGFPVYKPRQLVSSGYQGTLGYGYATAIGVKVGNPDKKVVQVSGDGGFMYNVAELATSVQYGIQLVTIIFKDNRFGNVNRAQKERPGKHVIGSEFHNPDFVKLAESFGAQGLRVTNPDELEQAILKGFDHAGPTIIEVPVGEMTSPWRFIGLPQVRELDLK